MGPGEFFGVLVSVLIIVGLLIFAGYNSGLIDGREDACIAAGYDSYDEGMEVCIVQIVEGNYRAVDFEFAFRMTE